MTTHHTIPSALGKVDQAQHRSGEDLVRTIWKVNLTVADEWTYTLDGGVEQILSVGIDPNGLHASMWVLVDPEAPPSKVSVAVVGTGNPCTENAEDFIGTVTVPPFAWHIFARVL